MRLRIKELIDEKGKREGRTLTQKEVAMESKVDAGILSRYTRGFVERVDMTVLERLIRYFNVPVGEILVLEEEKTA